MPNIASVLKGEIVRLSSKAARQHVAPVQSATVTLRKQMAALRKQLHQMERDVAALKRESSRKQPIPELAQDTKVRFTAKGLRSLRGKLGLSADEFGRLVGVSQQTIYSWEGEKSHPRLAQVPAIAALRKIGKREARSRLEETAS
jgi:DNA-binding XRE family transcriptional regulator